jgi:hypothetical protein
LPLRFIDLIAVQVQSALHERFAGGATKFFQVGSEILENREMLQFALTEAFVTQ